MRRLQYRKLCELLDTLEEAETILSGMSDASAKAGLVSDMIFFVNKITQYAEGITGTEQFATALRALEKKMSSERVEDAVDSVQISNIKEKLDEIAIERTCSEEFRSETDFSHYIDLLFQAVEDGYSIIITSMDTPCGSSRFTSELGEKLQRLGMDINLCDKWRVSYCSVIDEGIKVDEKISGTHSVSIACTLGNAKVLVKSAGMQKVDSPRMCSVIINGRENAVKRRGISFVIYDKESDAVVDSVNFDTFSEGMSALRSGMLPALKEFIDSHHEVTFISVSYPSFPKDNLSKNEKWIIRERIHYSTFYQNPMLPSPLSLYIKEPSGILEVLRPPRSYIGVDEARHFEDYKGKYLNIVNGHRLTLGQPERFFRTIYVVGGCGIFGIGVRDAGTLASQLQKLLNINAPEEGFNVENYGFALDGMDFQKEVLAILKSFPLKAGDIVVGIGDKIISRNKELDVRPYRHGELFFDDMHVTEAAHGLVAEGILDTLKEYDFFRKTLQRDSPCNHISKGNYHLSETQLSELEDYKRKLKNLYADYPGVKNLVGAIVMNCNPFTLGHRYLIETCAKRCDMLIVFVVQEDKSYFPFTDRYYLVKKGCSDLENVCVIESGKFILSSLTFSEYFNKSQLQNRIVDSSEDVTLFVNEIAPAANIKVRFVGTEPLDTVTNQYNRTMELMLSQHGIRFEEIFRLEKNGNVISASRVRRLLESKEWAAIQELVPEVTLQYLKENYSQ